MRSVRFDRLIGPYRVEYDGTYLQITGTPDTAVMTSQSMQYDPDYPVKVRLGERDYGEG
ncbi:hypothetical protein SEA_NEARLYHEADLESS_65 [Mycobacterium phage NearlyHeadless]|nr:hypothetical protein SEA_NEARLYHEADLESS_65 [Mycobacterium phage NearlyHeadless]